MMQTPEERRSLQALLKFPSEIDAFTEDMRTFLLS
jgi:hypothetical protein